MTHVRGLLPLLFLSSGLVHAQLSTHVSLFSDYVWRGISQTDEKPALQAALDFTAESGLYVGVWGSNVDMGLDVEFDGYLGIGHTFASGIGIDLGYVYYHFVGDNQANLGEGYLELSYKILSVKYSADPEHDNDYLEGALHLPLGHDFGLELHFGTYDFDTGSDYEDYKVALSKEWAGFTFDLAYTDTNLDHLAIAERRIFLGVTKTWIFGG